MSAPTCMTSVLLRSAGFSHGFSTRDVGFDELALLLRLKGAPRFATQVHGTRTVAVEDQATNLGEADALVATRPNIAVGVRTADCVPILLADSKSGAVAAVHAGWRGLVDGVIESALTTKDFDLAAIGPCIGACCFEIGEDVAVQLAPYVVKKNGALHGDLRAAVRARLVARNMQNTNIDDVVTFSGGCTKCEASLFHSYRRDGANAGRQLSVIESRSNGR